MYGGIEGYYPDSGEEYAYQECFIDGVKCFADAAYIGGIVIETCELHEELVLNAEEEKVMDRLSLENGEWYAMEIIGDEFGREVRHYSPIKIISVKPLKSGKSFFTMQFYHANYPEGVRNKAYTLKTIQRCENFLLAKKNGSSTMRYLLIFELSVEWFEKHFPGKLKKGERIVDWLERNA
ncbi:hypothetical protein ACFOD1_02800 [Pseudidiomarina halophila]|uniref:Uncharacterized protein n=1 Tax=Pseudidiomarina halophila TaxID=1449799 RepID=A0A432XYW7_9GAMM|nr:hypothetical protein [Pseudidiomarina halophila]RUO53887.1 hypothetical protein CWI69_00135 [Pseudidiomarina halophila]